jgi:hypothetical protein
MSHNKESRKKCSSLYIQNHVVGDNILKVLAFEIEEDHQN